MFQEGEKHAGRRRSNFSKIVTNYAVHNAPHVDIWVPGTFMKECPHTFQSGNPITLVGPSGNKWVVKAEERSILSAGWRAFAHDHRLREVDQLHYTLRRPSHFVVDIMDSNGDEKRCARKATVTEKDAVSPVGFTLRLPIHEHSRKRKERETSSMSHDIATTADQCEIKRTDSSKGSNNNKCPSDENVRLSDTKDQRACSEAMKRREVITILDSEDDDLEEQKYGLSKIEGLIEHMKGNSFLTRKWAASLSGEDLKWDEVKRVATGRKRQRKKQEFSGSVHQHSSNKCDHLDEDDSDEQDLGDPLRRFTRIFDTNPGRSRLNTQARESSGPTINLGSSKQASRLHTVDSTVSNNQFGNIDPSGALVVKGEEILRGWEEEEQAHLAKGVKLAHVILWKARKNITASDAG